VSTYPHPEAQAVFSDTSLHSRITNAFSDIGRPRSGALARFGPLDLSAQDKVASALRTATPK